mgnify:CR=1 FL=1
MSPRVTLGLAVIVALVAAYIFAVDRPQAKRAEEATHLIQLSKADVTGVTLESAKGTVELTRRDATHWGVTRPIQAPAASFTVSDLLDTVTGVVPQRTLPGVPSDLAAYGLVRPAAKITLRTQAGRTVTLEVGTSSPVATALYARVVPGSAIYLVDSSVKDAISKSATDLRQKTLADFANADVQKVSITSPNGSLAADRLASDRWRLEGAHPWPADDFKVSDLFFPLTTSEGKVFHDGVTDPAQYGLDHPAVTVELALKGRKDPLRVLLTRRGKVVDAMVAGSRTVLELDPSIQAKLTPTPLSLVSQRVLPYNAQDLTAVIWRRAGQTLEVRRQGPGFTGGGLADKDISEMFSALNILDGDKVEALGAPPSGAPAFEIQTDGAEDARFTVAFYRQPDAKWLAIDRALALKYQLTANALDGIPQPIKSFLGLTEAKPAAPPSPATSKPTTPTPTKP